MGKQDLSNMNENQKGQRKIKKESPLLPLEQLITDLESQMAPLGEQTPSDTTKIAPEISPKTGEQYIRFTIDAVHFAVPLKTSLEVGILPGITPLPNLPTWVSGISNVRGEIVSIVDLKAFWGRGPSTGNSGKNMVLLRNKEMKVGFKVDRLTGITFLSNEQLQASSNPFNEGKISPYLTKVVAREEGLLHLLDVEKLLTSKKLNAFRENKKTIELKKGAI
jgi:purine-binding chemotaxis protein CheW